MTAAFRFQIGSPIMCNFEPEGWKPGKVIAHNYREDDWPKGQNVPYQVALDHDDTLIFVPFDDDRFCREASVENLRISERKDALSSISNSELKLHDDNSISNHQNQMTLGSKSNSITTGSKSHDPIYQSYREGKFQCINNDPTSWLYVELFSEYYRAASRNNLKVTQHEVQLGKLNVGDTVNVDPNSNNFLCNSGFMQCPTLVRLPPGLTFRDDGSLTGTIKFDPYRESEYKVEFIAVSTTHWNGNNQGNVTESKSNSDNSENNELDDKEVTGPGIVRLQISFEVQKNNNDSKFDKIAFEKNCKIAQQKADKFLQSISRTWALWENEKLDNRRTCDLICDDLKNLRDHLKENPRFDSTGFIWAQLGGFHMNVHKLLENTLFECELYLGYAMTFGDNNVKYYAEQNLQGCYQKRLLECARFMWMDGVKLIKDGEYSKAIDILTQAAHKKEGWGWAVNYGDIWIAEAVARIVIHTNDNCENQDLKKTDNNMEWMTTVTDLLDKSDSRSKESGAFGNGTQKTHPWSFEIRQALKEFQKISKVSIKEKWVADFKGRTLYWCSQVLAGSYPFPPKCRPRLEDAKKMIDNLPGHNKCYA